MSTPKLVEFKDGSLTRTEAEFAAHPSVYNAGVVFITDGGDNDGRKKISDGVHPWSNLPYEPASSTGGAENTTELTNLSLVPGANATLAFNNVRVIGVTWTDANDAGGSGGFTPAANQLVLIIDDGLGGPEIGRIYPASHDGSRTILQLVQADKYLVPRTGLPKVFCASVSQGGTDDPVFDLVIHSDFAVPPTAERNGVGDYSFLHPEWIETKTAPSLPMDSSVGSVNFAFNQDGDIGAFTKDPSGTPSDGILGGVLTVTLYPTT